ncbi:putative ribosomal protein s6-2 [Besnoitia besnoiti]|uniref:Putative ribosomal protein s6-2 n=1 Tax=Besnoitia besnoiti TaxID=94643 RepID=A0A2A9MC54_BESBE|nr:putative ribosomal protein s6-2 [Besnoitia besnoiti]PFH34804.1 putative ribosomal protein s6-2 [Besnoitia besnoiti]
MVFYETFVLLSKRMQRADIRQVLKQQQTLIEKHSGSMLAVRDLGWRKTAFRIIKPRQGIFWFGRLFYFSFGTNPAAIVEMSQALQSTNGVLRHTTTRMKKRHNLMTYNHYIHARD